MYIPKKYIGQDKEEAVAFMRRFNFASIITSVDEVPMATHLPFVIEQIGERIKLHAHFALANPQWKEIVEKESLIIFSEPHAYISPSHYEQEENVPTWNYVSVHVYGKAVLIEDHLAATAALEAMMDSFEPAYKKQWQSLSKDYKDRMLKGIKAFELDVTRMQFKEKLSQNKNESERDSIINDLRISTKSTQQHIAEYMDSKTTNKDDKP